MKRIGYTPAWTIGPIILILFAPALTQDKKVIIAYRSRMAKNEDAIKEIKTFVDTLETSAAGAASFRRFDTADYGLFTGLKDDMEGFNKLKEAVAAENPDLIITVGTLPLLCLYSMGKPVFFCLASESVATQISIRIKSGKLKNISGFSASVAPEKAVKRLRTISGGQINFAYMDPNLSHLSEEYEAACADAGTKFGTIRGATNDDFLRSLKENAKEGSTIVLADDSKIMNGEIPLKALRELAVERSLLIVAPGHDDCIANNFSLYLQVIDIAALAREVAGRLPNMLLPGADLGKWKITTTQADVRIVIFRNAYLAVRKELPQSMPKDFEVYPEK